MFTKNGQGFYEFDFNTLVGLTSKKFTDEISAALESRHIKALKFDESDVFVSVSIICYGIVHLYTFHKVNRTTHVNYIPMHIVKWASVIIE